MRNRTAALILTTAALVGMSTAAANAALPTKNWFEYSGPWANQAVCTSAQLARYDASGGVITTACFYDNVSPGFGAGPGPGWFYRAQFSIS